MFSPARERLRSRDHVREPKVMTERSKFSPARVETAVDPLADLKADMVMLGVDAYGVKSKRKAEKDKDATKKTKALKVAATAAAKASKRAGDDISGSARDDISDDASAESDASSAHLVKRPAGHKSAMKKPSAAPSGPKTSKKVLPPMPSCSKDAGPQRVDFKSSKITMSYPKKGFRVFKNRFMANPPDMLVRWSEYDSRDDAWKAALSLCED
jgi:hypothetical protein